MILMGLVSMVIFFGMPKLVENSTSTSTNSNDKVFFLILILMAVDPEMKAEFEERQREGPMAAVSGGQQNPLGNFDMAAFLAGSTKKESSGAGAGSVNDGKNEPVRR